MSIAHVVGIDPGLVHTGVVSMQFESGKDELTIRHTLIDGPDADLTAAWIKANLDKTYPKIYVEAYRPRQRLGQDVRMVQAEAEFRRALPSAKFLPNMGIKKVVHQELMEALEVWTFKSVSHHQDVRSAARIALLGMLKDDRTNEILADAVRDHLDGYPWTIHHL